MDGNLRRLRQKKVLSQKALAELSCVSEMTISRAERGDTVLRPSTAQKLAKALDVSPEELMSEQGRLDL